MFLLWHPPGNPVPWAAAPTSSSESTSLRLNTMSGVSSAGRREKQNWNAPIVIPKRSIAARLAKLRTGPRRHIFDCYAYRGKTVPSAYHLARSCYCDLLLTDKQTLEDYGFNRAYTHYSQMMMPGLYQGLFKYLEINPEKVLTWKREGIFLQEIKKVFGRIPPQNQGQYHPWFLEHQQRSCHDGGHRLLPRGSNARLATHWRSAVTQ